MHIRISRQKLLLFNSIHMLNAPILQKLTKRLEVLDDEPSQERNNHSSTKIGPASEKPKQEEKQDQEYENNSANVQHQDPQRDILGNHDSDSSSYVIKPNFPPNLGHHSQDRNKNRNITSLNNRNQSMVVNFQNSSIKRNQQNILTKKEENSEKQIGLVTTFDQKYKRKFVLSMLDKVDSSGENDKMKILRKEASKIGVTLFDAKIWVIGYKIVFQIEDQLGAQTQVTEQIVKQKIARKIRQFWEKDPNEKRYNLLKLQSIIFKAFEITEYNPGIWFDNHVNESSQLRKGNQLEESLQNFSYPPSISQSKVNKLNSQKSLQDNYKLKSDYNLQFMDDSQNFQESKIKRKYQKGPPQANQQKLQTWSGSGSLEQKIKKIVPTKQDKNDKLDFVSKGPSFRTNKSTNFPLDFRAKVAQKLDKIFTDFMNKSFSDKASEFCINKEVLKQIYDDFGTIAFEKKRVINYDRKQLEKCLKESEHYSSSQIQKILSAAQVSPPNTVQKLILRQDNQSFRNNYK